MFEVISEIGDEINNYVIEYNKELGVYRVSIFMENHFKDDFIFDEYERKEKINGRISKMVK